MANQNEIDQTYRTKDEAGSIGSRLLGSRSSETVLRPDRCLALALSGCLLTSGERPSMDALPDGGNVSTTFVGAEGNAERTVETGANGATLNAIVIVQAERGELRLELLNPDGQCGVLGPGAAR